VLCRTGLVWKSTLDGQVLTFRLIGVNNQNFIMEDEQTGTWWQQVTGEAITGPLEGKRLEPMFFDQVTWEVWSRENPASSVLESRPEFVELYWPELERDENRDGELIMSFPIEADADDELALGELVQALRLSDGREKAYPMRLLREQNPVSDRFGGKDVLIVVAADDRSVRAFDREVDGSALEFYRLLDGKLVDAETKSEWDFSGLAVSGELEGTRLRQLQIYADYWFDWNKFHPDGLIYAAGEN